MTTAPALDPDGRELVALPPAWPARPWIYGNVIMSANGIVTWTRAGAGDDPVRAVAGGDFSRPGRRADVRLMRRLRAAADAVSFGAQTLRDQPDLIGGVEDAGGDLGAELARRRAAQGRPRVPLQVVYSESGRLDLSVPLFTTPGLTPIVVTTAAGARRLGGATVLIARRGAGRAQRARACPRAPVRRLRRAPSGLRGRGGDPRGAAPGGHFGRDLRHRQRRARRSGGARGHQAHLRARRRRRSPHRRGACDR